MVPTAARPELLPTILTPGRTRVVERRMVHMTARAQAGPTIHTREPTRAGPASQLLMEREAQPRPTTHTPEPAPQRARDLPHMVNGEARWLRMGTRRCRQATQVPARVTSRRRAQPR